MQDLAPQLPRIGLNIVNGVREFARATPEAPAVRDGARTLTYAALDDRSSRLAQHLLAHGLRTGERVAVLLGNRAEFFEVAAGLAKAGLVMVPLNPRLAPPEADFILEHSSARALILDDALAAVAATSVERLGIEPVLSVDGDGLGRPYERCLAEAPTADPSVAVDEDTPFAIAYTSGTTGRPKGVMISHRSRVLCAYGAAIEWGLGPGRRTMAVAPMYHGAGFLFAWVGVFTGGCVSVLRRWDPEAFLDLAARDRAQSVFLVPTHAQTLRELGEERLRRCDLSALEVLYFNAAPLAHELKLWVLDAMSGVRLHEVYGSTEAGIVCDLRPADQLTKVGSVGPPWFMTEVRVVDDDGRDVAPGGTGELFSRSPLNMTGYLLDPEATRACTTTDGFLSAGDVARLDEDGYVYIVDRKKDVIITGGANVYGREVEEVLLGHPGVRAAAVVGTPDERWGEAVTAVLVGAVDDRPSPDALVEHCRPRLAGYKIPRRVEWVDVLPTNSAGKVLKRELRDRLSHATQR
jgi:long-chain acyl-CoA synthetase